MSQLQGAVGKTLQLFHSGISRDGSRVLSVVWHGNPRTVGREIRWADCGKTVRAAFWVGDACVGTAAPGCPGRARLGYLYAFGMIVPAILCQSVGLRSTGQPGAAVPTCCLGLPSVRLSQKAGHC